MTLRDLIRSDLGRFHETYRLRGQPYSRAKVNFESFVFKAGFQAVLLYRISHWLFEKGLIYPAWFFSRLNVTLTGAEIEFNARIGPGFFIAHPAGIVIGRGVVMGARATVFQGVNLVVKSWSPDEITKFPKCGDGCFFFAGATVLGDVTVGGECVIAAAAVVSRDVPGGSLAIGSPAGIKPDKGREMIASWSGAATAEKEA